jgi:iron complex transport system ATP-binding protein
MNRPAAPLLETRRLSVGLGVGIGSRIFCRDLDLELYAGERLAILGRNGAGKSTLLSVLAGLREPQAGEVRLKGASYAELGPRQAARVRGWLPQSRNDAFASTVLETALVGRHPHLDRWGWESAQDAKIVRQALAAVGLADFEQRDIQSLSGGERQRLAIATLLAQQPELFLLDEPLAYLDLKYQIAMLALFADAARESGAAVAMVLHEPALAWRFCDRVLLVFGDGRCECGPTAEMLNAERLSDLSDYPLRVFEHDGQLGLIPR